MRDHISCNTLLSKRALGCEETSWVLSEQVLNMIDKPKYYIECSEISSSKNVIEILKMMNEV